MRVGKGNMMSQSWRRVGICVACRDESLDMLPTRYDVSRAVGLKIMRVRRGKKSYINAGCEKQAPSDLR